MSEPSNPKRSAWPMATVLITLILVVGIPAGYLAYSVTNAPQRLAHTLAEAAADAVRPRVMINEVVLNSIADLHKESKLVVYTADISTDVTRQEGETSWGMYWGTNTARVAVKNARVQYVIDLSKLQTSDYVYDESSRRLSLTLPRPHVDTSMVAIDPAQIQTLDLRGGWARFDKHDTRDNAIAELRPKVIVQAQAPFVQQLAQASGIQTTTQFLQPLADTLSHDGVTLRVAYRD